MPPKKKGGGKKKTGKKTGAKGKGPTVIDGVPVSEMTKEQLEGHVRRLQEEVSILLYQYNTVIPLRIARFSFLRNTFLPSFSNKAYRSFVHHVRSHQLKIVKVPEKNARGNRLHFQLMHTQGGSNTYFKNISCSSAGEKLTFIGPFN